MSAASIAHFWDARWRERWLNLRNKLIADPRFQRWAAASPLTRFVARRRTRQLFDLCAGFVYSQILLACVRLRLFETLAEGPCALSTLSVRLGLSDAAALRLLRAAISLRLVRALPNERFALDDLGASLLGNPSVFAFIEHHALLYDDLRDPVALLRGEVSTRLSAFWPYAAERPQPETMYRVQDQEVGTEIYEAYSALMSRSQELIAQDVLDAYPLDTRGCLMDVGGGEGAFVAAAAVRWPRLDLKLLDLPPVAERARAKLAGQEFGARIEIVGVNFLRDPLPRGADTASLIRVLHDHDDESALVVLRAVFAALPVGGELLIAEPMAGTPGAEPIGDAYFGFYLEAMGRGRPRTVAELTNLLQIAGFSRIRELPTHRPLIAGAILAKKV
ncbi:MAG: methyltransferase [Methylocystis sp.]